MGFRGQAIGVEEHPARAQGASLQYKRFVLPTFQRPSGLSQELTLYRYRGSAPGPKVWIQAGVHASEVQGIAVLHFLMARLAALPAEDLRGELSLLPMANPYGLENKVGEHTVGPFFLANGQNWNRAYARLACRNAHEREHAAQVDVAQFLREHAERPWPLVRDAYRAELLRALTRLRRGLKQSGQMTTVRYQSLTVQKQILRADRVLDLHTSTRGVRFAYVPNQVDPLLEATYLDMPYFLIMGQQFAGALDEAVNHPWQLLAQAYRKEHGATGAKPAGLTLELGSQEEILPEQAEREADNLLNWLRCIGSLAGDGVPRAETPLASDDHQFVNVCAPHGGLVAFEVEPGMRVSAGQRLAQILVWSHRADSDPPSRMRAVIAPCDGIVLARYPSAIVHQGAELYKLMTHPAPLAQRLESDYFY